MHTPRTLFLGLCLISSLHAQRPDPGVKVETNIPYAATSNPRQALDLYLPTQRKEGEKLPVIVFIHGGGWKAGDKASAAPKLMPLVKGGLYAGVSVGYRLTNEAQWPSQIHDCKAAIRWVKGNAEKYGLDAETSGDVPALEGDLGEYDDQSSAVTCVINFFGPENFQTMVSQTSTIDRTTPDYPEALLLGGRVQDKPDIAKEASPVTHVSAGDAKFLTAHGTKDPLVPFAQATELHEALKAKGVASTLVTMADGGHGFASAELDKLIEKFLALHLRGEDAKLEDVTLKPSEQRRPRPRPGR
jgi:acetyl esterase/lipase